MQIFCQLLGKLACQGSSQDLVSSEERIKISKNSLFQFSKKFAQDSVLLYFSRLTGKRLHTLQQYQVYT